MDDDIWDDGAGDSSFERLQREREQAVRYKKFVAVLLCVLSSLMFQEGIRDGIEKGKEETMQEGFEIGMILQSAINFSVTGFKEAYAAGLAWGVLRGRIWFASPRAHLLTAKFGVCS
jgi:hypothetical protein